MTVKEAKTVQKAQVMARAWSLVLSVLILATYLLSRVVAGTYTWLIGRAAPGKSLLPSNAALQEVA